jgi:RimJ/RimL family protein N-acetyltransferase
MVTLTPILESHADALFPLVHGSNVTDTLVWDGPDSLEELREGLRVRELTTRAGEQHIFAILAEASTPIGCISLEPDPPNSAGAVGLWIGREFHGRGFGTEAVRLIVEYGFRTLALERLHAGIFVGNAVSRRIFEKNGFILEGTLRHAHRKRGVFVDEWVFAILREDFDRSRVALANKSSP